MCSHERALRRVRLGNALACLGLVVPFASLFAQSETDAAEPGVSAGTWVLTAGGDVDDEDGYRLDAGVAWFPGEATSFSVFGGRADSSADFNDFSSGYFSLGFDHSFGPVGITADARWWGDSDLVDSRALGGSLYLDSDAWRVAVRGELRESEFAEFDFDTVVPVQRPGGVVLIPISGTAECSLDNTALGASARRSGPAWSFTIGGTAYDYDDTECDMRDVVFPPGQLPPLSREIFRRIAARVLAATGRLIGTELTRENGFLEYSVYAGLSFTASEWTWSVDYFHDREEFIGSESDTLVASVAFPIADRADLELRAGATDLDVTGTVAFVGVTVFAYFGGGR